MSEANQALPLASVIIPTRDRAEDLAASIPAVLALDYPSYEVIVVDQSTSDATEKVVRDAVRSAAEGGQRWELTVAADDAPAGQASGHTLVYRHTTTVGVSKSLNEGVRLARGEVMAFTPDDSMVPATWLRRGVDVMVREPDAGLVFGAVDTGEDSWRSVYVPTFKPSGYARLRGTRGRLQLRGVMGANMFISRRLFERAGYFDECLGTGCRFRSFEDADLAYRALKAGFAVVLDPENCVLHRGERDFADGTAQRLIRNARYGKGAFLIKHLRCGDPLAVYALMRAAFGEVNHLLTNLVRRRTLTGAGRLFYLFQGVGAGLRQPIDRSSIVYLSDGGGRR